MISKVALTGFPALDAADEMPSPPPGLGPPIHANKLFSAVTQTETLPESRAEQIFEVSIVGLPRKLLSEAMVEGMLDQIGFGESLLSFSVRRGEGTGCVSALFADVDGAQLCVDHFHGRSWDAKGDQVHAHIWPLLAASMPKVIEITSSLSADALAFEPSSELSADAPAFIPLPKACRKLSADSETSTDLGESDTEVESCKTSRCNSWQVYVD